MSSLNRFFTLFLLSQTVLSARALFPTAAVFPLYSYPDNGCTAWTTLFDSITANPDLLFYIILNPNSGPSEFDSNFKACVPQLLALGDNIKMVGYVDTGNGKRASADVLDDIATYMAFPTTYRPTGIFFDDVTATSKYLSKYTTYAEQVRTDVPSDSIASAKQVIFNPGVTVTDTDYFTIADFIVTFEDVYDDFSYPSSLVLNTSNPAAQQMVLLLDAPSTLSTTLIDDLVTAGLAALFITSEPVSNAYDVTPPFWGTFCADLTSLQ